MEGIYYTNMYAGDYRNTSDSKPDQSFSYKDTEYDGHRPYYLNEDSLRENSYFENKNKSSQNAFLKSNKPNVFQNRNEEYLLKNDMNSENIDIQSSHNGYQMLLSRDRRDNLSKEREIQTKAIGNVNFVVRPSKKCLGSHSAPSILSFAAKQRLSGEENDGNEQQKIINFRNEERLVEHPTSILSKVSKKVQPPIKKRTHERKGSERCKNFSVNKRQDSRRRLKIPFKRLYLTENGEKQCHNKSSLDSANEIKYIPDRRNIDETDRCSSYSESDLRYVAEEENPIQERNRPYVNIQQSFKKSIPRNSMADNEKFISNFPHYSNNKPPYDESFNENYSKKSDSRFTTDSFLRMELSDFKEFLMYRRYMQRQRTNREKKLNTVQIPVSFKPQKMMEYNNRMQRSDNKNVKERANENRREIHSHLKTRNSHTMRRPKVSDDELWKRFEYNFRRYASTRRYSGEVIPRKISNEWMSHMGVVGDLLTERDADNEFKKAAGPKITMNVEEYKEFLLSLTMKRKLPLYEIYRRMCGF